MKWWGRVVLLWFHRDGRLKLMRQSCFDVDSCLITREKEKTFREGSPCGGNRRDRQAVWPRLFTEQERGKRGWIESVLLNLNRNTRFNN